MVFMDTPGIHKPMHKMNEVMVKTALATYNEVDVILMLVEATEQPGGGDKFIIETLSQVKTPVFLLINKVDLVKKDALLPLMQGYSKLFHFAEIIPVSALKNDIGGLLDSILKQLPQGPKYFPTTSLLTSPSGSLCRSSSGRRSLSLRRKRSLIPRQCHRRNEGRADITRITAVIFVERDSQKGILIGKGGGMLKQIGTLARLDAEKLLGTKIFLQIW